MTAVVEQPAAKPGFAVRVADFTGPLDLLLSLIAKHELELTALALHQVTDDFIAHINAQGDDWDLDEATEFLVIAATLLDLKASRLLPTDEEPDEEDLALLEARDMLFSRLLQYRAYKKISAQFDELIHGPRLQWPRTAGLDPELHKLLPDLVWKLTPADLPGLLRQAHAAGEPPQVSVTHIHSDVVSLRQQAGVLVAYLRRKPTASFDDLIRDCPDRPHVIARFLAVLELLRAGLVEVEQAEPMARLDLRWVGGGRTEFDAAFDGFEEVRV